MTVVLDRFDHALLNALIEDSTRTNAQLSEIVKLSPSQCSRRRAQLEAGGIILGYGARIDETALGFGLRAITRVRLSTHDESTDENFTSFLNAHDEVERAYSVSGDADYVLTILTQDLASFASFVHRQLLPPPAIAEVRSEIVLMVLKS